VCLKLDDNDAVYEDELTHKTSHSDTAQGFTDISAQMQIANQCALEDDLDEVDAFPVFNKWSSRRLRRTSIEIYRKSLHDAECITSEEEYDTNPITLNTESDTAAVDVEMHPVTDDALFNERTQLMSTSDDSQTSVVNFNGVVQPNIGIVFHVIC